MNSHFIVKQRFLQMLGNINELNWWFNPDSEMTYTVLCGTLNSAHSLTQSLLIL